LAVIAPLVRASSSLAGMMVSLSSAEDLFATEAYEQFAIQMLVQSM
jgi:hypothetical protein